MKYLFPINAEGGPILCVDANCGRHWRGAESPSSDYDNLCAMFDASPQSPAVVINVGDCASVAWEMSGGGTADVFRGDDGLLRVSRAWLNEDTPEEIEKLASAPTSKQIDIGEIEVPSGLLALMWAPESGQTIPQTLEQDFQIIPDTSMGRSGWVLKVARQRYRCFHDELVIGGSQARRLTLIPL